MKVKTLQIHNFRSIADIEIELQPYSLLIGPNNAGKSNVIAAIRVFYEKGLKYDRARDFPKFATSDGESWIEIEYEPSADEFETLKEEYRLPGGTLRVRKFLESNEKDEEGKQRNGIYAWVNGCLSGSRFYGAKNVQQGKLGDIIYVPAVSKLDDQTKLSGPSPFRDLINAVLSGILESSPSYQELVGAFGEFGSKLKREQSEQGHSLELLECQITEELRNWGHNLELLVNSVRSEDVAKNLIGHQIVDALLGTPLDPAAFGHGFQRHLIYTLIKLAAQYESKPSASKSKEFSPRLTWLLFEEPEAFLHPTQVAALNWNLRRFAFSSGQQVTLCSHNSQFASHNMEDIPAILRVNREGAHTVVGQVRESQLGAVLEANQACIAKMTDAGINVADEDTTLDMESIKYALWLNPTRASVFFGEHVLLVEGPSEHAIITYLLSTGQLAPKRGVTVVDTIGKWNTHRFMNILSSLRVSHAVLYDRDKPGARNDALEAAIASMRTAYTKAVDCFDPDFEGFLGIPKGKVQDHRKPQYVMWQLLNGKIAPARVSALCDKLQLLVDA